MPSLNKRLRLRSPTARTGGASSRWDTTTRYAGTTRSSRTSSGANSRQPTSKPPRWLDGSPYSPTCTQTYREWRELGASIGASLIRAGEAAKAEREHEKGGEQVGAANLG